MDRHSLVLTAKRPFLEGACMVQGRRRLGDNRKKAMTHGVKRLNEGGLNGYVAGKAIFP